MTKRKLIVVDEHKLEFAGVLTRIAGVVLTFVAILIGLFKYFNTQSYESKMEFRRTVWKQQLDVYTKACKYAGLIATDPTSDDFEMNVKVFGGLYWGEMIMVEDTVVENAMKDFYYAIIDYDSLDIHAEHRLKFFANELAQACQESSERKWNELQ